MGRPRGESGGPAILNVVFVQHGFQDSIGRPVEPTLGLGGMRSMVRQAAGSGVPPSISTRSMRIAMTVRVPMSVTRHKPSPDPKLHPDLKLTMFHAAFVRLVARRRQERDGTRPVTFAKQVSISYIAPCFSSLSIPLI